MKISTSFLSTITNRQVHVWLMPWRLFGGETIALVIARAHIPSGGACQLYISHAARLGKA